jgi:ABC-type polysaccharide/polyol phosphate transport system ATPase subunit
VVVDQVSKRFRLYNDRPTSLKQSFTRLHRSHHEEFWAVRDVSLEIPRGSAYGLIGHNGSGKSTLLRLIAGIHRPTKGRVVTDGRISALLELGAGFHPELTGRENVYLNAAILGLSRRDVDQKLGQIIEFSGLEQFIDAPVKIYSSGMYVRLGFSVAVHVDPEILIVDEVIAVGDEEFQRRCLDHLYDLRRRGLTIVVVSHAHATIEQICDEAAWLDHGQLMETGEPHDVVSSYLSRVNAIEGARLAQGATEPIDQARHGSREIEIEGFELLSPSGSVLQVARSGDAVVLRMRFNAREPVENPVFGIAIYHESGVHLAGPNTSFAGIETGLLSGRGYVDYALGPLQLLPGSYRVTTAVFDSRLLHAFDVRDEAFAFRVQPGSSLEQYGLVDLRGRWATPVLGQGDDKVASGAP